MNRALFLTFLIFLSFAAKASCPSYKALVCHAGSEKNPKFVEICVSFSSLYGHLAEHENDYYGECRLRNVKSSYVCNAGLRHQDGDEDICIRRDDVDGSAQFVSDCGNSKNCTCSGAKDLYLFDYMNVNLSSFDPFSNLDEFDYSLSSINAGKDKFNVATTNPAFSKISDDLGVSFFLGSERMSSEYFVDTCWMNTTGLESYELGFSVNSQITSQSSVGLSYPLASGLHSRYLLYCDQNFDGIYNYSTVSLVDSTNYHPFSVAQSVSFNYTIEDSEFCFIRQSLKEIYPNQMRPWDLKNIQVSGNVESLEENSAERAIDICHIKEISKNNNGVNNNYSSLIDSVKVGLPFSSVLDNKKVYECSHLRFRDSDHLKEYVSFAKDAREFRDIHQHDYVGFCNNICAPIHGNGAN